MLRAVLSVITGTLLVAAGLALSPVPWLALIWTGGVLVAVGLLREVDQ